MLREIALYIIVHTDVFAPAASAFIFIIWENVHMSACLSSRSVLMSVC